MSAKKLEINERETGGAVVFDIIGELTIGSGTEKLLDRVRTRLNAGQRTLLVNMAQCRRVDSSGLGELVTCLVTSARQDATLRLTNVPQQIQGIMKMSNIYKAFEILDTEDAALEKQG
ncbi:MAG TPA: STAS domain-containing protein [Pyrinomonadaceae bacterium]|jgi:anti-sigma B factor antagonist